MTLTVQECFAHIKHALHGDVADLAPIRLVNQAGFHIASMHTWKWRERPAVYVPARAKVTGSSLTVSGGTTLTDPAAGSIWANYTRLEGDSLNITVGGAGATTGVYKIASKTDDDTVELETAPGNSSGDVTIDTEYGLAACALPSDFAELVRIGTTSSLIGSIRLVTLSELLWRRTDSVNDAALDYWAAIAHAVPTAGGQPVKRLELWPAPSTYDADAFTIFYRAGWTSVSDESDTVAIPDYCENLFIRLCRAFAQGYEEDDDATLSQRLAEIQMGPEFKAAKREDSGIQRMYGGITGGHASPGNYTPLWTNSGTLGGPV